jgi:hypothetical protein
MAGSEGVLERSVIFQGLFLWNLDTRPSMQMLAKFQKLDINDIV